MRRQPHRLVFIDETGTNTHMTRLYGRSLKGERLFGTVPYQRSKNQTMIAGLAYDGLVAPWVIDGALNREVFNTWVEKVLAPTLNPGTAVILDNLAVHKSEKAANILKAHKCWFLFLPPYSPDMNPIEMAFSKLKAHLRRIGARSLEQLIEAIGEICDLFTPEECWNYFREAGYAS